jgi:hypothetical protein
MFRFRSLDLGRRRPGLHACLLIGLAGVALAAYSALPAGSAAAVQVANPPSPVAPGQAAPGAAPAAQAPANPYDMPLRLVNEAARTYQQVQDYTCTLIQQERIKGILQPENVMLMKFRVQPFSVYMRWMAPRQMVGQEVCFVKGRNNDMMRVHATGLLRGAIGFISIHPRDPRVLEHSRHTIEEAGMGNLIAQLQQDWLRGRQTNYNKTQVRLAEFKYDNRPCTRVELIALERSQQFYCYRALVYFDQQTHLPVRMECYDWPRQGGPPDGDLIESFSYANLRLNVGLGEADFNY